MDSRTSSCLFCKKLLVWNSSFENRTSRCLLLILQEILLLSHHFLMTWKFKTQRCQWFGVKRIISIFADKGNRGTNLGNLLITSSSPRFFNKTDLEQYLFKNRALGIIQPRASILCFLVVFFQSKFGFTRNDDLSYECTNWCNWLK